jgi:hypothetical protein
MTTPWEVRLNIDARGHDDTQVTAVPRDRVNGPQLRVRVGMVVMHCLDASSVMSAGMAWATARLLSREWLPDWQGPQDPLSPRVREQYGWASTAGSVIFDGRQPWHAAAQTLTMVVTVGPLRVAVHDFMALDTHLRAWMEASAQATRLFPGRAVSFNDLLDRARAAELRRIDSAIDKLPHRLTRATNTAPVPRRQPQARGRD